MMAAFELFARDGYANTSIEQICQTAYVGNKAFYELFDSKEDCYLALLREMAEQTQQRVAQALRDSVGEKDVVRLVMSVFVHALVDDPRIAVVGFGECAGISPRVEAQRREHRRWAADFIEAFWRSRDAAGGADHAGMDYHALAVAAIGGLFETIADWLSTDGVHQPATVDKLVTDLAAFTLVVESGIAARTRNR